MSYFGFEDKPFYKHAIRLAIPLVIQQVISTSMFLVDNMMVGTLGDHALAAVNLANQVSFLMTLFIFGITGAASSFTAQFWGIKDRANIRKTLGITVVSSEMVAIVFFLVAFFGKETIMTFFSPNDIAVQQLGVEYLEIACFVYPVTVMTMSFGSVLRATENVKLPTISGICAICLNALLNYCLINGNFGFPKLGVRGAAIATLTASIVDMLTQVGFSYILKKPPADRQYPLLHFNRKFISEFYKVGTPMMVNEGLWALSQVTITYIYAQIGTHMAAAMSVVATLTNIAFVALVGLATASMVMTGQQLGMGDRDKAFTYAQRFLRVAPIVGVVMAIVLNVVGPLLLGLYDVSEQAKLIVRYAIVIYGVNLPILTYNHVLLVGILRAGGDARFTLVLDSGCSWLFTVGTVALVAFVIGGVPDHWIYAATIPGSLAKFVVGRLRFKSKRWMNNLTERAKEPAMVE